MSHCSTSGCPLIASLTTAIVLLLAPFTPPPSSPSPIGLPPGVAADIVAHDIVSYVADRDLQSYLAYQSAVDAQIAAQAAEAARQAQMAQEAAEQAERAIHAQPAPVPQSTPQPVSGACGGATNGADQFIQRESGGDPSALNPSGAYGCYQIMPGTWAGAGCNDLGAYGSASPSAQAACASRLDLSAWAL